MNSMSKTRSLGSRMLAIFSCVSLIVVYAFVMPLEAQALYTTDRFDVEIKVDEDNVYWFHEKIDVNFETPHHGIYRYIPERMVKINSIEVPGYEKKIYSESRNKVIQIGSADYTLTGKHSYDVLYRMQLYDDKDSTKDILSLDVIPTGWGSSIEAAKISIILPKTAPLENIAIYSGTYGSKGNEDGVKVETKNDGKTILLSADNLPNGHGITVHLELPEGYWEGELSPGILKPWHLMLIAIGPILAYLLWYYYGRDDEVIKTLEFYPPDDITPGEVGYFLDGVADRKDILSTIVYLADKGCISIKEEGRKNFYLNKIKPPDEGEPKYIRTIFNGLFGNKKAVRIKDLDASFGIKYETAKNQLANIFKDKRSRFTFQSHLARAGAIIASTFPILSMALWVKTSGLGEGIGSFIIGAGFVLAGAVAICGAFDRFAIRRMVKAGLMFALGLMLLFIGLIGTFEGSETLEYVGTPKSTQITSMVFIATVISIMFAVIAIARTKENNILLGRILGFKDFIKKAELDKLNKLVEEDPEYFYHILPYAYVFGLTNKWIKNFESIPIVQPKWMENDYDVFDAYVMGRVMTDWSTSLRHNIHIPTSGDSGGGGGFSGGGGGFSGGGFGGGGGGAW